MMVDEGEVKTSEVKTRGFVFNKEGFLNGSAVSESITTTSFTAIWAISLKDLQELGRSSEQINKIVSEIKQ